MSYKPGTHRLNGPYPVRFIGVILVILISLVVLPFLICFYVVLGLLQAVISLFWFYSKLVEENL